MASVERGTLPTLGKGPQCPCRTCRELFGQPQYKREPRGVLGEVADALDLDQSSTWADIASAAVVVLLKALAVIGVVGLLAVCMAVAFVGWRA